MFDGYKNIGIIGAGGWGTALSKVLAENGCNVTLWAYEKEVVNEINSKHTNSTFLEEIIIPEEVEAADKPASLEKCDIYIIAAPTQFIRNLLIEKNFPIENKPVINVAKGIERNTLMRVSEILQDVTEIKQDNYVVLTGPSHAEEVALQTPTTVVAASANPALAVSVQQMFSNDYFRVYTSNDVTGCEMGGSLKNVIAIAAGIVDGMEIGDNTKAAIITRGLAEISRLGTAIGANHLTFSGLSGLGDLFVTCNSRHSRNRNVGELIGKGMTLPEIQQKTKKIAEGVFTTESAYNVGKRHDVEMPIAEQIYEILFNHKPPAAAIKDLMNRQTKQEWWW